jgi:DNA-binding transcriptional ArsR family regulator
MTVEHVFTALADPTRRLLIEKLTDDGAKTATQLADELPITRQGVTKHLKLLEEAGLVNIHQRGRDKYYYLNPEPLSDATTWIGAIAARWDERLAALSDLLDSDEGE